MPACHATRAFWPIRASDLAWLGWLVALAALLMMASSGTAEARTAKIALVVSGDEQMQADLKELVERFEKDQPLSGDSLGLLQGAHRRGVGEKGPDRVPVVPKRYRLYSAASTPRSWAVRLPRPGR